MRILGFSKRWGKFSQSTFTTFRFEHRGTAYQVGEQFQIKIKPRSKGGGEFVGVVELINKEPRRIEIAGGGPKEYSGIPLLFEEEAIDDGFPGGRHEMFQWLQQSYGHDDRWVFWEPMQRLTLMWI